MFKFNLFPPLVHIYKKKRRIRIKITDKLYCINCIRKITKRWNDRRKEHSKVCGDLPRFDPEKGYS